MIKLTKILEIDKTYVLLREDITGTAHKLV